MPHLLQNTRQFPPFANSENSRLNKNLKKFHPSQNYRGSHLLQKIYRDSPLSQKYRESLPFAKISRISPFCKTIENFPTLQKYPEYLIFKNNTENCPPPPSPETPRILPLCQKPENFTPFPKTREFHPFSKKKLRESLPFAKIPRIPHPLATLWERPQDSPFGKDTENPPWAKTPRAPSPHPFGKAAKVPKISPFDKKP